jgi:hypothetical protein
VVERVVAQAVDSSPDRDEHASTPQCVTHVLGHTGLAGQGGRHDAPPPLPDLRHDVFMITHVI